MKKNEILIGLSVVVFCAIVVIFGTVLSPAPHYSFETRKSAFTLGHETYEVEELIRSDGKVIAQDKRLVAREIPVTYEVSGTYSDATYDVTSEKIGQILHVSVTRSDGKNWKLQYYLPE